MAVDAAMVPAVAAVLLRPPVFISRLVLRTGARIVNTAAESQRVALVKTT